MANEKRLIDANALTDAIERTDWYHISPKGYLQKGANSQIHTPLFKADDIFQALKDAPTVDAYTEEQVDSIIQKADLLEIENRNLEQEVDWLKNCLNCEIRNKCPRHCGKVVHGCDHWIDGDPLVHGRWVWKETGEEDYEMYWVCSKCGEHTYFETNYCPNCGAKMDGDGNG